MKCLGGMLIGCIVSWLIGESEIETFSMQWWLFLIGMFVAVGLLTI